MRAAAVAQQHVPELQVVVFGNDRAAYSYESPHSSGSWKNYMLEELKDELDWIDCISRDCLTMATLCSCSAAVICIVISRVLML